eukprot:2530290-Ditylum_brightwellii.AAC.1
MDGEMMNKLSDNIMMSAWVDCLRRSVEIRKEALPEIIEYIERVHSDDHDNNVTEAVTSMCAVFETVNDSLDDSLNYCRDFVEHIEGNLIYDDDNNKYLPILVFSFIRLTMGAHFLLHILLSMGKFATENDSIMNATLQEAI